MTKEIIGIIASVIIIFGFTFKDELLIRFFNFIGAGLWLIYGVLTNSSSVILFNVILIVLQIKHIYSLLVKK